MIPEPGGLHHVELWVPDLERAISAWEWLLTELGYEPYREWPLGRSWRLGTDGTYVVLEQSEAMSEPTHDRLRPGVNHLAFCAGAPPDVDRLTLESAGHGWALMFPDVHPHAGGPDHYAAYLEGPDGFEVELVAAARRLRRAGLQRDTLSEVQ